MCKMETKTKMYPDGSTYKRQILHLCPDSDGTTPCISYRDSDERLVKRSSLLPPVKELEPSPAPEPPRSKEKRRYWKLGTRLIQIGGSRKKDKEDTNRKRRSLEPKPDVVIVQSASRGQDSMPEAPMAPTARPLYEQYETPYSRTPTRPTRLEDPIILEEVPARRRRPTSGVSFAEGEPVIIEEATPRRRRPTSGVSFAESVLRRSTPPQTPASRSRERRRTEHFYEYPNSPVSPPSTPRDEQHDLPTQRAHQDNRSRRVHELHDLQAEEDARQARLEKSRADARETARLQRRLEQAQLEREMAESRENKRQHDIERTRQQMAKERMSAEARERAERVADEALEIQGEETRRQEERDEEIRGLLRRIRYYEGRRAEKEGEGEQWKEQMEWDRRRGRAELPLPLPLPRTPDVPLRYQPVIVQQAPRDLFREEGHRVLAEARRARELDAAMERLELAERSGEDDRVQEGGGGLGRRATTTGGGQGRRSESYYRDRARRRREFWVMP